MSRLPVAALVIASLSVVPAVATAQEAHPDDAIVRHPDVNPRLVDPSVPMQLSSAPLPELTRPVTFERPSNRSSTLLFSLYASTAAMQALDVHSTMNALGRGAIEANPLMRGLARNKTAFVAMKAGLAASTILAARNMAKQNKVAAISTLVVINSAYAMIMRHNYKVARSQR